MLCYDSILFHSKGKTRLVQCASQNEIHSKDVTQTGTIYQIYLSDSVKSCEHFNNTLHFNGNRIVSHLPLTISLEKQNCEFNTILLLLRLENLKVIIVC